MGAASAVVGGVSAVAGISGAAKQRSDAKKVQKKQEEAIKKQQAIVNEQVSQQKSELLFQYQRQNSQAALEKDMAIFANDLQAAQADSAQMQSQIELDQAKVQNNQQELQRVAAANAAAQQVFNQIEGEGEQAEKMVTEAEQAFAQQENAQAARPNQGESLGNLLDDERKAAIITDLQGGFAEDAMSKASLALRQLGYEENIANIEKLMGDVIIGFSERELGRQGQLNDITTGYNRENIQLQDDRNLQARTFATRQSEAALALSQNSSDIAFASQKQAAAQQARANSPSLFPAIANAGLAGFKIYDSFRSPTPSTSYTPSPTPAPYQGTFNTGASTSSSGNLGYYTPSYDYQANFLTDPNTGNYQTGSTIGDVFSNTDSFSSSITPSGQVNSIF